MLLAILNDLRAHLRASLSDIEVDLFPDHPASYRFIHPKAAVLIGYIGADYDKPHDTHAIVQTRRLNFSITIFGRGVHHDAGAIAQMERVRLALAGHRPVHCNKIHLVSERYLSQDGGAWQYELKISTETQSVEAVQADNRPRLTQVHERRQGEALNPNLTKLGE